MSALKYVISKWGVLFTFCCLTGCLPKENIVPTVEPQCIGAQSACEVSLSIGDFSIAFNQLQPKAETPFEIHVEYQGDYQLTKLTGHMEGIDMFMGKIPLFFNKKNADELDKHYYFAETMFGSCSLDKMRWKIFFNAELMLDGKLVSRTFFIDFTSFRQ